MFGQFHSDLSNSLLRKANFEYKEEETAPQETLTCGQSCTHFFKDYPYSFFNIRRRQPGVPKNQPRKLKFIVEIPHSFDYWFWNFDVNLIEIIQYFHVHRAMRIRQVLGYPLAALSFLISYISAFEIQLCVALLLCLHQKDAACRWLTHFILLNILIGQGFKRIIQRKRPFMFQPPRAFQLTHERSSGLPSKVAMCAPSLFFAYMTSDLVDMNIGLVIPLTLLVYLFASFARVHLGSCYPSDCLISFPLMLLVIGLAYGIKGIESLLGCQSFCNYNQNDPETWIDLRNFSIYELNYTSTMIYLLIGYIIFGILTSYPVEFWRKTPYMFANILAIYMFQNIMLCPNAGNGFKSVLDPVLNKNTLHSDQYLQASAYTFIFFSFASTYIVNTLLGRRTGHVLSLVLRSAFFFVILGQTLTVLTLTRLMIVTQ